MSSLPAETTRYPMRHNPRTPMEIPAIENEHIESGEIKSLSPKTRRGRLLVVAKNLFAQDPDWVTFFRDILGVDGFMRKVYTNAEMVSEFEKTDEYRQIQQMLANLRAEDRAPVFSREPTRVITVRMPVSLHNSLKIEAHDKRTSMNKLCISKLVQSIDVEFVPSEV